MDDDVNQLMMAILGAKIVIQCDSSDSDYPNLGYPISDKRESEMAMFNKNKVAKTMP